MFVHVAPKQKKYSALLGPRKGRGWRWGKDSIELLQKELDFIPERPIFSSSPAKMYFSAAQVVTNVICFDELWEKDGGRGGWGRKGKERGGGRHRQRKSSAKACYLVPSEGRAPTP